MNDEVWKAWNNKPKTSEKFYEERAPLLPGRLERDLRKEFPPHVHEPFIGAPPIWYRLVPTDLSWFPYRLSWHFPFIHRKKVVREE